MSHVQDFNLVHDSNLKSNMFHQKSIFNCVNKRSLQALLFSHCILFFRISSQKVQNIGIKFDIRGIVKEHKGSL